MQTREKSTLKHAPWFYFIPYISHISQFYVFSKFNTEQGNIFFKEMQSKHFKN